MPAPFGRLIILYSQHLLRLETGESNNDPQPTVYTVQANGSYPSKLSFPPLGFISVRSAIGCALNYTLRAVLRSQTPVYGPTAVCDKRPSQHTA